MGLNTYDQTALRGALDSLGIDFSSDALSGHVPWILWLYAIFSCLPFPIARLGWIMFSVASLGVYVRWAVVCEYVRKNAPEIGWLQIMIAVLSFFPLLNTVRWGQSNFLICLGLMGFLYYRGKDEERSAGLSLSFVLIKPHLFVPLVSFLITQAVCRRRYTALVWCFLALIFQTVLTGILSPATVLAYPVETLRAWSATQITVMPSAALLLAYYTNMPSLRIALLLIGVFIGVIFGIKTRDNFDRSFSLLLPLGFLFAPFCWSHTFVVLLPKYLKLASALYLRHTEAYLIFIAFFVAFQTWISLDPTMSNDAWNVIIPLGILVGTMGNRSVLEIHDHR